MTEVTPYVLIVMGSILQYTMTSSVFYFYLLLSFRKLAKFKTVLQGKCKLLTVGNYSKLYEYLNRNVFKEQINIFIRSVPNVFK